jgi:hypothetical protein
MNRKKVAIMQPYLFPYLGYFQLIQAVDSFVFYDDVNFIKKGWIHRNRILVDGKEHLITFSCIGISQNRSINEVGVDTRDKAYQKILKTILLNYKSAPYFEEIFPLVENVLTKEYDSISSLSIESIKEVCRYIGLNINFYTSSLDFSESKGLERADRLIDITKSLNVTKYINVYGGKELYEKQYFLKNGIELNFLKAQLNSYKQFQEPFCPGLSIIDVLMFNDVDTIKKKLLNYTLE